MRVRLRTYEFVVAPTHEVEQVIEKLGNIGGANEVFQPRFRKGATLEDPQVLVVELGVVFAARRKRFVAIGVGACGAQASWVAGGRGLVRLAGYGCGGF